MTFDDQLKRAVDTLGERLLDDIGRELSLFTDSLSASAKADREAAAALAAQAATDEAEAKAAARVHAERAAAEAAEATPSADESDTSERLESLVRAIRAIDEARSLHEVLDALVAGAAEEAERAGVLLVRGGRLRGWRFAGFADSFDGSVLDLGLHDAGIIAIAVEQNRPASSEDDGPPPPFAGLADRADSTEAIAIPIAIGGETVAVLYVDQADDEPGVLTLEPAILEVLARHASRALEALTAFKAARSMGRFDATSPGTGTNGANNGGAPAQTKEDEEDEAARRYARLVISEIKLYHGDAVAEGRRDRNLAARLGGEIARARALYEQRVPAHLRGAAEHFHAELVRTLAGGDASLFAKASLS